MKFIPVLLSFAASLSSSLIASEGSGIPASLSGLSRDSQGHLQLQVGAATYSETDKRDPHDLKDMLGNPVGAETGIALDFKDSKLDGTVAYGPLNEGTEFPTVAFLAKTVPLHGGRALLECKATFDGPRDFFKLKEGGAGVLGFRVIDGHGQVLYEGRVAFRGHGPYEVLPTIVEGPLVNQLSAEGCLLSFETQVPVKAKVIVDGKRFEETESGLHHSIQLTGLEPGKLHAYKIDVGGLTCERSFATAPRAGTRHSFRFAFASASRATTGGGERDFGGVNASSVRAVMAAAVQQGAVFLQATGDLSNGANTTVGGHLLEYANFKRSLDPFWARIPVYPGFGDHEDNLFSFAPTGGGVKAIKLDRFPYETESGEAVFAQAFYTPDNGPVSEDADGTPVAERNYPPYARTVYAYTYDNVGMIVLNTEYWKGEDPRGSGSPEGYIMDRQLAWLAQKLATLEADPAIDHIFVNLHSAVFPNGDHASGAMWYHGVNQARPRIQGKASGVGILERRDQLLDLCVNHSHKFLAFLSGDEHNFAFLEVGPQTPLYLPDYAGPRLSLSRTVYHINNGGAGSAAYAMLPTPWSQLWRHFTEPPTVALIHVDGAHVHLSAYRAETLSPICKDIELR